MLLVPLTTPHSPLVILDAADEPRLDISKYLPLFSAFILGGFWEARSACTEQPWSRKGREFSHGGASLLNSLIPGLQPPSNNATSTFFDNLVSWRKEFGPL